MCLKILMQQTLQLLSTDPPTTKQFLYIKRVKQMTDMTTKTYPIFQELAEIADCWMNDETIEEYMREEEQNIQCDELSQTDYTV